MDISLFEKPTKHPYSMLAGQVRSHTNEKESMLAYILGECIEQESWDAVETTHEHPGMVREDLLYRVGDHLYTLTKKAKGLLYGYYRKDK